jgi:ABC-type oligopeptide transport system substrate-binding subunit
MKRLSILILVFLIGLAAAQPQPGGVLRVGMQADPVGLDPHITNATSTRNMLENAYDTLVMFDSNLRIVPALAESWSASADGLEWTFQLRDGVTFHNGEPLEASDVAFSINRIKDPEIASPRADDFAVVTDIATPDANTVVMTLAEPFSPLLSKLAASLNVVVSEDLVNEHGDLQDVVIGTGPFRFVEYVPQTRMVLERNEDFWGTDADGNPLPYLDGITFQFYPDPTSRTTAVQTGNVDWIEYVPAADVELLRANPDVEVVGGLSANFRSIYLNVTHPPFDNVLVRRAMSYAIDEQSVVDLALFGTGGVPATGTTIPPSNYYGVDFSPYVGRDGEMSEPVLTEEIDPRVSPWIVLAVGARQRLEGKAVGLRGAVVERGDVVGQVALCRGCPLVVAVDELQHEEVLVGVVNPRNRERRLGFEIGEHPRFELQGRVADLRRDRLSIRERHPIDGPDHPAREFARGRHLRVEHVRDPVAYRVVHRLTALRERRTR